MRAVMEWVKTRKTIASSVVIALVAAIPLSIAALHPGFPVSDVDLTARDVWVTNGEQLLGGRLNRQIDELNASVVASSAEFDVLQGGDKLFMYDPVANRVESVNAASTKVTSAIDVPDGSEISLGGDLLTVLSPAGKLWAVTAVGDLRFNYVSDTPLAELGEGAHATVTESGVVLAVSATEDQLYRFDSVVVPPKITPLPDVGAFQLAAVGEQPVLFDQSTNEVIFEDGQKHSIGDSQGLRLQHSGPAGDTAVIATANSLVRVELGTGVAEEIPADIDSSATDPLSVAAPVNQDGCAHGAWPEGQRYLLACEGAEPAAQPIEQPTQGSRLEFRVNGSVIALNDLMNGNVWLIDDNMRLVENWDDVVPPVEEESEEEGEEKSSIQSFEDTLAERTDTNRPPTAQDDEFGIRPGRTTILSLLDNDSDPDGDVLVISRYDPVAESTGSLDPIDGGRALQFTPAEGFVGTIAFGYTVDDGRGGTDTASVTARVSPTEINEPPYSVRGGGVSVEANQTVTYNVLADWRDPDGDDLYLVGASPKSGDLVRFTPDGFITFTHQTAELGEKEVVFQVSDGIGAPTEGTLKVTVEPAGSLNPVGTPDFATAFPNETVIIEPLLNDLSPSGAQLSLVGMDEPGNGATASLNSDKGTVTFSAPDPGIHYVLYTLQAGANTSVGIIRIDVRPMPEDAALPPIAVKDTAYLRGDQPVTVSVLSNDVSPTGKILAVQSISVPADAQAKGLVVELLESTLIRVTATAALTEQVNFTYTISDGLSTATAGVTVVPVPALTKHQPPVAANDAATVRAGDITTLDVLDNDFHPDDSSMFLDTELITEPTAGIAFVAKNQLRFQAPREPGEYRVDYRVLDPFGETGSATAIFTVTAMDEENNNAPAPEPVVGRVLAGGNIRIDLPLSGVDPDGDSVQLLNFPKGPTLGTIGEQGNDYFVYEASPVSSGTDTFTYEVFDTLGATGTAEIKIAVIPEPGELQNPTALPDSISIRPGRVAQVKLTENDSDPQGAPIKVSETLIDVPEGIEAEVVQQQYLVITAPETEQSFSLRYELTNNRGGSDVSYVLVTVTEDAPLLAPSAEDVSITPKEIAGESSITIDLFDGFAFNPAGRTEDMLVALEGPNAAAGEVIEPNGQIVITPGPVRQAITYSVTNVEDDLSALAFILVPAAVDEDFDSPPYIDPNLPIQYVSMNETREWKINDFVIAPSGRDVHIYESGSVSAVQSNGSDVLVDEQTLRFTPPTDYRGPASINFTVSDGDSKNDPKAVTANLTLQIVVGDPEFRDTPPEFTTPSAQVEVGETATTDLRLATAHPNPQILSEVTYEITGISNQQLTANLSGSTLSLSVPRNTVKGTTYTVDVMLRWDKFEVPGTVNVTAVGSTRPPAVAVADSYESKRPVGTYVMSPLVNDSNPYQATGEPLRIVDAQITNAGNVGTVSFTDDQIRVTPASSPPYIVIEVAYTIEDATEDADRRAAGLITFTVTDVPAQVQKPAIAAAIGDDKAATITFQAPASHGKDITSYEVRASPAATTPTNCTAGAPCTITGLTNGTAYTFQVLAVNENGAGAWSNASDPVTPYGTPPNVGGYVANTPDQWGPNGVVNFSWAAVAATGGTTEYVWDIPGVQSGRTTGTTTGNVGGLNGGSYSVTVYAINTGGKTSTPTTSGPATITQQAAPPAPTITSANQSDVYSPANISWTWSGVSANPGGTANLRYEVRVNGGGWEDVGGTTSYGLNNRGTGTYTLEVRAVNKAGAGNASAGSSITLQTRPDPPRASLCYYRGDAGDPLGNGYNADTFGIVWSGQSGGNHTMKVDNANNSFSYTHSSSGASGSIKTQSWAYGGGAGNQNTNYWVTFDGVDQPAQRNADIPNC